MGAREPDVIPLGGEGVEPTGVRFQNRERSADGWLVELSYLFSNCAGVMPANSMNSLIRWA